MLDLTWIPKDAGRHDCAILICYHILQIKDAKEIAEALHYTSISHVYHILKKNRDKIDYSKIPRFRVIELL